MKAKIDVFDINHIRLKNGDIFKSTSNDDNFSDLMCLMWVSTEMRFKVVYLKALERYKNQKIISDVLRAGYFLTDNNFIIVGNYLEKQRLKRINNLGLGFIMIERLNKDIEC